MSSSYPTTHPGALPQAEAAKLTVPASRPWKAGDADLRKSDACPPAFCLDERHYWPGLLRWRPAISSSGFSKEAGVEQVWDSRRGELALAIYAPPFRSTDGLQTQQPR